MTKKFRKAPKKTAGRPSKLTDELQEEIVDLIKAGNYVETAVAVAGLGKNTFYEWMKKANQSKRANKYTRFRDAVKQAQAWSEARDVAIIAKASEKQWTAAAWRLERKFPEKWGRKDRLDLEHSGKVSAEVKDLEDDEREQIKDALDFFASEEGEAERDT